MLYNSAYGCGNLTMSVNAPQLDPFRVGGGGCRDASVHAQLPGVLVVLG